jgi:hypothetical protein
MGTGTDVAMEAADITLIKGDLRGRGEQSGALARDGEKHQAESVFRFYLQRAGHSPSRRVCFFPYRMDASPILASAAMALSSVSVISNALRLRGFKIERGRDNGRGSNRCIDWWFVLIALTLWFFFGPRAGESAAIGASGVQEVTVVVKGGYSPDRIEVKRGHPCGCCFAREAPSCTEQLIFGELAFRNASPGSYGAH